MSCHCRHCRRTVSPTIVAFFLALVVLAYFAKFFAFIACCLAISMLIQWHRDRRKKKRSPQ